MITKIRFASTALSLVGIAALAGACAHGEGAVDEELAGIESPVAVEPLATYNANDGLSFVSPDMAANWHEEAPGVWRRADGEQRLIIGQEGHRWALAQLDRELAELRAADADASLIEAKQAKLAGKRDALAKADGVGTAATCSIGLYTGPSSPFTGLVGGAALAELSCQNGTVIFTVETFVCAGTSGCGSVSRQTAIPTATPALWGQARSGVGSCYSDVFVTPANVGQSSSYTCG